MAFSVRFASVNSRVLDSLLYTLFQFTFSSLSAPLQVAVKMHNGVKK
jgi:hypothetical protein